MRTTVRTYETWRKLVSNWHRGQQRFLGVFGGAGLSKSYTIRQVLGPGGRVIRCHGSSIRLFKAIHEAEVSQQSLILDDIDNLLKDVKTLNILKGAFDPTGTNGAGWIQWDTETKKIPAFLKDGFDVTIKIAVISNEEAIFTKHLRAVEDRGLVARLCPDAHEVHRDVGAWWPKVIVSSPECPAFDEEVFAYMGGILDLVATPSQRAYTQSAWAKQDGQDWRGMIEDTFCLDDTHQIVRELMLDPSFTPEERAERFIRKTQMSRSTYFSYQKKIVEDLHITPVKVDFQAQEARLEMEMLERRSGGQRKSAVTVPFDPKPGVNNGTSRIEFGRVKEDRVKSEVKEVRPTKPAPVQVGVENGNTDKPSKE